MPYNNLVFSLINFKSNKFLTMYGTAMLEQFDVIMQHGLRLLELGRSCSRYLIFHVAYLIIPYSTISSILGFALALAIGLQIFSGFFLSLYYLPEPGLVVELREEMFNDVRFGYEIYTLHLRGVDTIYILSYLHILKKIFLKNYIAAEPDGWLLGGYAFFWFHYVVALGITLGANHLSDLTLTIAANVYWSLFYNTYKTYYLFFTNKHLNADQLIRLMFFHYLTPWYYLYLVQMHVLFCHESWDSDSGEVSYEDKTGDYVGWKVDNLHKEESEAWLLISCILIFAALHHMQPKTLSYSFFERWNASEVFEIDFYAVAPHWYFKPFMGLLTISPSHYEGLLWAGLYFFGIACLPLTYNFYNGTEGYLSSTASKNSFCFSACFYLFCWSLFYTASVLPVGRYYYELEGGYVGNTWTKLSYQYIYMYLLFLLPNFEKLESFWEATVTLLRRKAKFLARYVMPLRAAPFRIEPLHAETCHLSARRQQLEEEYILYQQYLKKWDELLSARGMIVEGLARQASEGPAERAAERAAEREAVRVYQAQQAQAAEQKAQEAEREAQAVARRARLRVMWKNSINSRGSIDNANDTEK